MKWSKSYSKLADTIASEEGVCWGHPVWSHDLDWDSGWNKERDKRSTIFMGSKCNIEGENVEHTQTNGNAILTSELEASTFQSITLSQVNHWYKT